MSLARQIYYNAIFGAIGGLLAWLVVGSFATGRWNIWLAYAFVGAGVGLCIGALTGAVEGAVVKQSVTQALIGMGLGAAAGAVGGLLGLLIGERFFLWFGGGLMGRALGWMLLGLFLGLGEGVVARSRRRSSYGALGGALAGLIGGLVYETLTQEFIDDSDTVQMIAGGLGLILIGAALGSLIPLAQSLHAARLVVRTGSKEGTEVVVVDQAVLGSYDGCDVYLPGDPGIAARHALVFRHDGAYLLRDLVAGWETTVQGAPLSAGQEYTLQRGDRIRLGRTEVELR